MKGTYWPIIFAFCMFLANGLPKYDMDMVLTILPW